MSLAYNKYLERHVDNVAKAYEWLKKYLPEVTEPINYEEMWIITHCHDDSKYDFCEYDAYDAYFYGRERTPEVEEAFNRAWLHHIHNNGHHWQYHLLVNDEPSEGIVVLDMPYHNIIEMVCDWFSFSFSSGDLYEIFNWYNKRKSYMKLSDKTRETVEDILGKIKSKLDELSDEDEE